MTGVTSPQGGRRHDTPKVVLVTMPFGSFRQPSAALGLLKADLEWSLGNATDGASTEGRDGPADVDVVTIDATLRFAELISPEAYDAIATWRVEDLLGDWIFSTALAQGDRRPADDYERAVLAGGLPEHSVPHFGKPPLTDAFRRAVASAREQVDVLLDELVATIAEAAPLVLGLTSMVHQHAASLALAERVKRALPDTLIVVGGPSCRGEMGAQTVRSFPSVDAVATGDGEGVLPGLVRGLSSGAAGDLDAIPGLLARTTLRRPGEEEPSLPAIRPVDLDRLPTPDYDDYFERLSRSPLGGVFAPRLPIEASRGCWWGEASRCAFCGQASGSLEYRQKSPDRLLAEMEELLGRHRGCPVLFTDEIVPRSVVEQVAPRLPEVLPDLQVLYFETRPGLTKAHLATLAAAGIRRLEVGIESLSTPSLKLMRKGTTARQGIEVLKWARELGVEIVWNLIWGLPGEEPAWNEQMAQLVPSLVHLQPPNTVGDVRLDRFSPLFEERARWGVEDVRPYPAYRYVYDLPDNDLARLAAHFTFRTAGDDTEEDRATDERSPDARQATALLADRVDEWKRRFPRALLWWSDDGERLTIGDSRPGFDTDQLTVLDGDHRLLYLACDAARPAAALATELSAAGTDRGLSATDVHELAAPLVEQGFLLRDGDAYLSLALAAPDR